ncbi:Flp pilus assembly protein CpaB [Roseibium aquae]|uniref:Flp pilus assembly protein CpaB n=1 Tax=Roseibium aquae TaxID=1323746 RepID=A0A916TMX6_9HYPH|nr:Flp pilus assembly protein CpaB [Roseibium aquae]GGB57352.1 Flp pilus assembly protein CpaB [Roseibium aquae]
MKFARLLVLIVALGAGLIAARMVMTSGPSDQASVVQPAPAVEETEVLVAAADIPLGGKLSGSSLAWKAWPNDFLPSGVITREADPDAADVYVGQIAKAPIYKGEPVRSERLIDTDKGFMAAILPKGKRAIAVSVEAETTAGGFILPGDKVDLILTQELDAGQVTSKTIIGNVRVLAIDGTTAGEKDDKNLSPQRTATLELTLEQSEVVARAQQLGTISLALRSAQDSADEAAETVERRRGVNFVRYGVSTQANPQ